MGDKVRALKDEATKLMQKGAYDKALEAFQQVLAVDKNDVTACMKSADILRKLGRDEEAIDGYSRVVEVYAADGLLLKAIAACKVILDIDPDHTITQQLLADLYAKKTGRAASASQTEALHERTGIDSDELPAIPLFSDLPKNAFLQLMQKMSMREVLPEEVIIREGDVDDSMFIIAAGTVKVTIVSESGGEIVLATLGDGAFFGEMALLSEAPRSASVIAVEAGTLFEVNRKVLDGIVKEFSSVQGTLLKFYRQRLLSNLMATSLLFRPLDNEQRKSLVEKFKSREVPANTKIVEEGQKGDGLFVLLSGKAEVAMQLNGKRCLIAHLKSGDLFGETSVLGDETLPANIKTLRKSIVLKLPKRTFSEIASTHPQVIAHVSDLAAERAKTVKAIAEGRLEFRPDEGLVVV